MRLILSIFVLLLLASCSTTKHLPEGESLYAGIRQVKIEKAPSDTAWEMKRNSHKKIMTYYNLWDTPNGSFLPFIGIFPARLMIYNFYYSENEKGFSHWMQNNFGEKPKTITTINPELKAEKIKNLYENWGHFGTTAAYQVHYNEKKTKGTIYYQFVIPRAYTYRKIDYIIDTTKTDFNKNMNYFKALTVLHPGDDYDLDKIKAEKNNLLNQLHDKGHYYLRADHINVLADTTVGNKQIDMRIFLDNDLPDVFFQVQTFNQQSVKIDSLKQPLNNDKYYHWPAGRMKKKLFNSLISLDSGDVYSYKDVRKTIRNLSELGIFANPVVSFTTAKNDSSKLNAQVSVKTVDASIIGFNVTGNYKNIGYVGPSVGVSLTQLNLFSSAVNLTISADAYYDIPIGAFKERLTNSSGYTIAAIFTSPLIKPPFKFINQNYSLPKKFLSLSGEYNDRKDYFDLISLNAAYGFTFKTRSNISHKFSLADITFSDIKNPTLKFDELVADNPSLKASLVDQFLIGTNYTIRIDNYTADVKRIGTYFESRVEFDGNLPSLIIPKSESGSKEIFGIAFSQLAMFSYDFRTYFKFTERSKIVFRNIGGIGFAYGNSSQLPYIRQFFIGGANSLRPLNARSVGPGRYIELNGAEVNQVGDLKIEVNLEYRIKFGPRIGFAVWTDAGNIWLLKEDPERPGSGVRWNKLMQDSYLTSGLGLRFDAGVLLLRFDYGVVLYSPFLIDGYRWIWQNKLPLYGPVIGFGYPF